MKRVDITMGLALIFLVAVWFLKPEPANEVEKFLNPPPEHIEHFHFGFRESTADSLWLRWIQDVEACQTYLTPVEKLQSDPNFDPNDLTSNPRHKVCDNSWGFKMLDSVTKLAPRFEMAYLAGASALAVLVEDYKGASIIYDRGLQYFPNNWHILYRAAYHFQYDENDLPKAASLLTRAADNGAPAWVKSLASRLYTEAGQMELGLTTLMAYRKTVEENPEALKRVDERIRDIQAKFKNNRVPRDE